MFENAGAGHQVSLLWRWADGRGAEAADSTCCIHSFGLAFEQGKSLDKVGVSK